MKVLFVAFSSVNSEAPSASVEFISSVKSFSGSEYSVCSLELPYEWDRSFPVLEQALEDHWNAVVLVGSREDVDSLAIERIALNDCDISVKDAKGRRPLSKTISEDGDPGYWSGLPFRTLVGAISEAGVSCFASHSAGAGVANLVFYKMMQWIADNKASVIGGLIQVPEYQGRSTLGNESGKTVLAILLQTLSNTSSAGDRDRLAFDLDKVKLFKGSPTP